MQLDENTTYAELEALDEPDRYSEQRRRELERIANVLAPPDTEVRVNFQDSTAFARQPDGTLHDFEINIPVEKFEQIETSMDAYDWDRRVQLGLLFHELGHVLYSDFEGFQHHQEDVASFWRPLFRTIYNAAEDVVIERQLASEFDLARDFRILNDTFSKQQEFDQIEYVTMFAEDVATQRQFRRDGRTAERGRATMETGRTTTEAGGTTAGTDRATRRTLGEPGQEVQLTYTLYEALEIGILDAGFGEFNRFAEILDPSCSSRQIHRERTDPLEEIADCLDTYLTDMLRLRDPTERTARARQCFESVRFVLMAFPSVQSVRLQTESFRPVEADRIVVGTPAEADELSPEERAGLVGSGDRTGTNEPDTNEPHGSVTGTDDANDGRPIEAATELTPGTQSSPLYQEAETLLELIEREDSTLEYASVVEIGEGDGDPARWEAAKVDAQQLVADLRSQLRRRRRADPVGGHRTGDIDPHRLVEAIQGRNRVFQRREPGDERDYSCLLVLDRSGSMRGDNLIDPAENATAQLVHALHAVGVDVSVLSLYDSQPRLELPFGGEPHRFANHLLSGRASGGTPLSSAIEIARELIDQGSGTVPFVVVITDGEPASVDEYREQLERYTIDVYGVYIGRSPGEHAQFFDRVVYTDGEQIATTLRTLVRSLFTSAY